MIRLETWTKEVGWGTSTLDVTVLHAERVRVADGIAKELGLDPALATDTVDAEHERFIDTYDYNVVADAMRRNGWTFEGQVGTSHVGTA